ncbi:MAG TPA: hypothetical protein VKA60_06320 [Blastocatellia bacterium]|nr:hypothetical protein [Blastocatellia bacterium]
MKKLVSLMSAAVLILGLGVAAFANTPYINRREHREQQRIRQGERSGELTRREAGRLEAEQGRIRGYEWYAKSDGHVSRAERHHLDRMLDRSSRDIYRQKHDGQDRLP